MPVLQPCSKALKLGVGLFVLSLFVWQLLESRHEQAVAKLNKTSLEALLKHLKSESEEKGRQESDGDEADAGRSQRHPAAFHFISSGLVQYTAAAHARMRLERVRKLAAAERQLRLALEVSDSITTSAGLGLRQLGVEAAVAAAGAAAEALAALKAAHTAAEPPVTFGVQLSCGLANRCGLWQAQEPQAAAASTASAASPSFLVAQPEPTETEPGAGPQSCTTRPPDAAGSDASAGAADGAGAAAECNSAAGPATAAAVAGTDGVAAAASYEPGEDARGRELQQCDAAAAAAVSPDEDPQGGPLTAATCRGNTVAATPRAAVAAPEEAGPAPEPAAPQPPTLYRRAVGGAAWLTSRLPPLLPLTAGGRYDLWYSTQCQLLALMPRYYLLLAPALAASGLPLPLLDWGSRRRLPHFTQLPPLTHQLQQQRQQPQSGPGVAPVSALGLGLSGLKAGKHAGGGAREPAAGGSTDTAGSTSSGGGGSDSGERQHGIDGEEAHQRELLLTQRLPGGSDALAECRLEELTSLWVLSTSAANAGASVARATQPQGMCGGAGNSSCCAGSGGALVGAALTPLVLPLPRLPRRARRVVCNVTVSYAAAAALSGAAAPSPGASQLNAVQQRQHVFSFVVYEELDTFSRSFTSVDGAVAATAGTGSSSHGGGAGSSSGSWLRSGAFGNSHGSGGRGGSSRRAAYAAAAGMYGHGLTAGWMRGGFHVGGGVLAGAWLPATAAAPAATADAVSAHGSGPTGRPDAEQYWHLERERVRRSGDRGQPPPQPPSGFVARWLAALHRVLNGSDGATLYYCSSYLCDTTLFKPSKRASDGSGGGDGHSGGIGRGRFSALQRGLLALLLPLLQLVDSLLGLDWRALGGMAAAGWRLAAAVGGPVLLPHLAVLRLLLPHTQLWQADVVLITAAGLICCYAECLLLLRLLLRWRADVEDAAGVRLDTPTANIIWRRVCQEASGPRLLCWRRLLAWRGPLDGALVCSAVWHYSCSRAGAGLDPLLLLLLPLLCRWEQAKSIMVQAVYYRVSAVEVATRATKQFIQVASTARLLHDSVEPLTLTQMAVVLEPDNRELWRLVTADDVRDTALPRTAAQHVLMAMQRHRNGGRDRPQGAGQREQPLRERERERERLRRQQEAAAGPEEGSSGGARQAADVKWPPPIKVPDGAGAGLGPGGGGDITAPRAFLCPITHDVMTQPCLLISPQLLSAPTYERSAIQTWLTLRQTDPRTNTAIISWMLLPNDELFRCIDDWARGLEAAAATTTAEAATAGVAARDAAGWGAAQAAQQLQGAVCNGGVGS